MKGMEQPQLTDRKAEERIRVAVCTDREDEAEELDAALSVFGDFSVRFVPASPAGIDPAAVRNDIMAIRWNFVVQVPGFSAAEGLSGGAAVFVYGPTDAIRLAFASGCRDFLGYPFQAEEAAARLFRAAPTVISSEAEKRLLVSGSRLIGPRSSVLLSEREREVLLFLKSFSPDPVSRVLLRTLVFPALSSDSRYIDIVISSLRRKIAEAGSGEACRIRPARRTGYCLCSDLV